MRHLSKDVRKAVGYGSLDLGREGWRTVGCLPPGEPRSQGALVGGGLKTRRQAESLQADPSLGQLIALSLVLALFLGMGTHLLEEKGKVSVTVSSILEKKVKDIYLALKQVSVCFRKFLRSLHSAWYI